MFENLQIKSQLFAEYFFEKSDTLLTTTCMSFNRDKECSQVILLLNQKYLAINSNSNFKVFPLDFNLKFEILRGIKSTLQQSNKELQLGDNQAYGLKFQISNLQEIIYIYFDNKTEISIWISELQKRINQLNIKNQIKICGKLKSNIISTFYYGKRLDTGEKVLIKAFSKQRMINQNAIEYFHLKIQMMREFLKNGKLKFYFIFQTLQAYYIVMEQYYLIKFTQHANRLDQLRCPTLKNLNESDIKRTNQIILELLFDMGRQTESQNSKKKSGFECKKKKNTYNKENQDFEQRCLVLVE